MYIHQPILLFCFYCPWRSCIIVSLYCIYTFVTYYLNERKSIIQYGITPRQNSPKLSHLLISTFQLSILRSCWTVAAHHQHPNLFLRAQFMAANSTPHKAFGITNIKTYVLLVLDHDQLNYDAWRELFSTHCVGFDVVDHIDDYQFAFFLCLCYCEVRSLGWFKLAERWSFLSTIWRRDCEISLNPFFKLYSMLVNCFTKYI